jgi:hypothetical protein
MENIKIDFKNCHLNSIHNLNINKKYKMRAGSVLYNNEIIEGNEKIESSTREFYIPNGHSWNETDDGYIIDWVMNSLTGNRDIKLFNKQILKNMGVKYVYHTNEKNIVSKIKRRYKGKF